MKKICILNYIGSIDDKEERGEEEKTEEDIVCGQRRGEDKRERRREKGRRGCAAGVAVSTIEYSAITC